MSKPSFSKGDRVTLECYNGQPEGEITDGPFMPGVTLVESFGRYSGFSYVVTYKGIGTLMDECALEPVREWVLCSGEHKCEGGRWYRLKED